MKGPPQWFNCSSSSFVGISLYQCASKYASRILLEFDGNPFKINLKRVSEIIEQVAYWRKANSIHAWFVENVQNGDDDCRQHHVSIEKLKELLELCEKVLESPKENQHLLPPQEGFFFGRTDDMDWYLNDINNTIFQLKEVIKDYNESENIVDYYYRSSW
jgi:hypothetical protein